MTHFYSENQLSRKTRNQLWKICDQIGATKRRSKSDCITEILALQPQLIEPVTRYTAVIDYDDSIDGLTQPYTITVNGLFINRTGTYAQAERFCNLQGYKIADVQDQVQDELITYVDAQVDDIQIDDYLFHNELIQPRSTESGTIPQQHNGYFELAENLSPILSAFDDIRVASIPSDVNYREDWGQKLSEALHIVEEVFNDSYHIALTTSDKTFLSSCLSV